MDLKQQRGAIPIDLDRPRVLFYDMNATWLLVERYPANMFGALYDVRPQTPAQIAAKAPPEFRLKSIDALAYFTWAGLQADAATRKEKLTLEHVQQFIRPVNYQRIVNAVISALFTSTATPQATEPEGKATAAAVSPAPAAPKTPGATKVSTSLKRSASRSASSASRRKRSGH